jgi:hypothetical protein
MNNQVSTCHTARQGIFRQSATRDDWMSVSQDTAAVLIDFGQSSVLMS